MAISEAVSEGGNKADREFFMPDIWETDNVTEFMVKGYQYDYSTMTDYVRCKSYFVEFLQDRVVACFNKGDLDVGWE